MTYCQTCGAECSRTTTTLTKTGHDYSVTTTAATCTKDGKKVYTCKTCGDTYSETIKATGHTVEKDAAVEATYTATGLTEGSHCSVCKEVLVAQTVVAKKTLAKPVITAENAANGITISWNRVADATGYLVYRGSTKVATIKSGNTLSYTDTGASKNGTTYTFKVYAYVGSTSVKSSASAKVSCCFLTRPTVTVTSTSKGAITVKWGKNSTATGYKIKYTINGVTKTVTVKGAANVSKKISSLKKKASCKVYVRAYKTVSGVTYYSKFSAAKTVTVKG